MIFDRLNQDINDAKLTVNRPAILAFSAGMDSVFLLHFLMNSYLFSSPLMLLYCRHGMRSKQDEELDIDITKTYAKEFSLPYIIDDLAKYQTKAKQSSYVMSETAFRQMRLDSYQYQAKQHQVNVVFTAHHKDDHLETVLMQLFRGTKSGFEGLQYCKEIGKICLLKPLLSITKSEIYDYIRSYQLTYNEDCSNQDANHARNILRLTVLPQLKQVYPELCQHVLSFVDYVDTLQKNVPIKPLLDACYFSKNSLLVPKKELLKCVDVSNSFETILGLFFYRALKQIGLVLENRFVIESLIKSVYQKGQSTQRLCKDWVLQSDSNWLLIKKGLVSAIKSPFEVYIQLNKQIICPGEGMFLIQSSAKENDSNQMIGFDIDFSTLKLRFVRRSDMFRPKGQKRAKKVFDLYKKIQVSALERPFKLALVDKSESVLWLEDFGCLNSVENDSKLNYRVLFKPKLSFAKLII